MYILLAIDYVSKWVEAIPTRMNEARVVAKCLGENIFSRCGVPRGSLVTRVLILTIDPLIHC